MFSRDSKRKLALTPDLPFSVISVFSVSQDFNAGNWDTKPLVIAFLRRNSQARPNFPKTSESLEEDNDGMDDNSIKVRTDNTSLEAEKLNVGLTHNGKKTNVPC